MKLSNEQVHALNIAARPMMDWIRENCHPHTRIIVDDHRAVLVEDVVQVVHPDGIPD